ncbi:MAG: glycosyltransferase family 39 protein, partial [Chloroflexi bacterium]|nr:glycosyltransferase family 39 protein [Chloroflexota bacterium]
FARIGIPGTPQNANHTRYPAEALRPSFPPRGAILAVWIIRLFSLLLGAGTVAMTYLLAASLFDSGPASATVKPLPLLAAALVAFNPMFLFISASVNNDNLVWLEAAAALFLFVKIVRGPSPLAGREFGVGRWDAPALGALIGLAALTKLSGLVLAPVAALALLAQALRTRQWRRFWVNGFIIGILAALVAGWWYARNVVLYHELLGLNTMVAIAGSRNPPATMLTLLSEWRSFWYSYWGVFGAFSVLAAPWVYGLFTALTAVAMAGGLWAWSRPHPPLPAKRTGRGEGGEAAAHALLILFILITFISLVRWTLMTMASQGRLMFTCLAPLAVYLAAGLLAWVPRRYARLAVAALVGLLGFTALFTAARNVAAAYLPPAPIGESQLPADLRPVHANLAPGAELIGYTLDSTERLVPGDSLRVTLYWRALAPMPKDYNLFLHVLGQRRALVGNIDTWPGGGLRPTSFWVPGSIYPDTYVITLDSKANTPTLLRLDMAMWDTDPAQPIPITDAWGRILPTVIVPVGLLDSSQPPAAAPTTRLDSTLEGGLALSGFDLPSTVTAGQPATLTLYWQTANALSADYTVFIHVLDSAGQPAAQADGPPLDGDWPTSVWLPNRAVVDSHTFTIPMPGRYTLRVGLYDPATVIPLMAFRADGTEWPDRAIELPAITVK